MNTIKSVLHSIACAPIKSVLTFMSVGFGVGVLIISIGMSSGFGDLIESQLESQGIVLSFANTELSADGELETVRPPQSDANILSHIKAEVSGLDAISPVAPVEWNEFVANNVVYRVRSVLGVNEQYADVMGLELIAGNHFAVEDIETGAKSAIISEELATLLFGGAEAAIGQIVSPPSGDSSQSSDGAGAGRRKMSQPVYTVGV